MIRIDKKKEVKNGMLRLRYERIYKKMFESNAPLNFTFFLIGNKLFYLADDD
jgi:hypothetical protein